MEKQKHRKERRISGVGESCNGMKRTEMKCCVNRRFKAAESDEMMKKKVLFLSNERNKRRGTEKKSSRCHL